MNDVETKSRIERILKSRACLDRIGEFQSLKDMGLDSIDIIGLEADIEVALELQNPRVKTGWLYENDTIDTIVTKTKYWKP